MSHSSSYPCTWCYAKKGNLDERGIYRTLGNIMQIYNLWCESGSRKEKAKNFCNCIHPPVFTSNEDKTFLQIIPPPELHLLLGVVNTLFDKLLAEFEDDATKWARLCNVQREITYGNSGFNGNSCKKLLKK